ARGRPRRRHVAPADGQAGICAVLLAAADRIREAHWRRASPEYVVQHHGRADCEPSARSDSLLLRQWAGCPGNWGFRAGEEALDVAAWRPSGISKSHVDYESSPFRVFLRTEQGIRRRGWLAVCCLPRRHGTRCLGSNARQQPCVHRTGARSKTPAAELALSVL